MGDGETGEGRREKRKSCYEVPQRKPGEIRLTWFLMRHTFLRREVLKALSRIERQESKG